MTDEDMLLTTTMMMHSIYDFVFTGVGIEYGIVWFREVLLTNVHVRWRESLASSFDLVRSVYFCLLVLPFLRQ